MVGTYNNDDVIGQDKFHSKNFKNNLVLAFKMFSSRHFSYWSCSPLMGQLIWIFSQKRFRTNIIFFPPYLLWLFSNILFHALGGDLRERGGLILYHPYFRPPLPIFNSRVGGWDWGLPNCCQLLAKWLLALLKMMMMVERVSLFSLLCCCCYSIALWGCFD